MVARRHHYVPQCYLNAFSLEKEGRKKTELVVFDKVDRKRFNTAPDNVALERDFNTIDLERHSPDAFEKAMASVESDIGPALSRIRQARSLANDDRTWLLNLIGLLHIRNPGFRERKRAFHEAVAKRILDIALSSPEMWASQIEKVKRDGFLDKDVDTDYEKAKQSYEAGDFEIIMPVGAHIASEMDTFDHALPLLFERGWVLVKAPEQSPGFITADHPVCLTWSEPQSHGCPWG
jgi:Protein of unknown function (DUF4238)